MLGLCTLVSIIAFAIVIPIIVMVKYYAPSNRSHLANIGWIFVAIVTWPLVPIMLTVRKRDTVILTIFFGSFLSMLVCGYFVLVQNISKFQLYL